MSRKKRMNNDPDSNLDDYDSYVESYHPSMLKKAGKGVIKIAVALFVLFIMLIIGSVMMKSMSLNKLQSASQSLETANHWFQFIRWGFIAALITWWVPINTWIGSHKKWNANQLKIILDMRWITFAVLVFVELIFVQRIYEWFIG